MSRLRSSEQTRNPMEEALMGFLVALLGVFALAVQIHAQDQSGFLSIDCGISDDAVYTDPRTGLNYISDASFIDSGTNNTISPLYLTNSLAQHFFHVRSFPQGTKNCYTLTPPRGQGSKYLIRARFMYGNYDGKNLVPEFDLHLGVNLWDSVKLQNASFIIDKEIIHVLTSDKIYICLVNTGLGTPFVSALELRLLNSTMYVPESGSLINILRLDLASTTDEFMRYKDDVYDRIWSPAINSINWRKLSTVLPINALDHNRFYLPQKVMQTAIAPLNISNSLTLYWKPDDPSSQVYFYLHFAEIQERKNGNQSREFNIYINGELWYGPLVPAYLYSNTIYSKTPPAPTADYTISINKTENSTLPPIVNAVEVYVAKQFLQSQTEQDEVDAVVNIKSVYRVKKNWQGDPCAPRAYTWDGLNCSYDGYNPPRIISLNLSSSGLTGGIAPYISNLSVIRSLDLSNNSLTGPVPGFLSDLPFLGILILTGNNFSGSIPVELLQRSKNGSLSLSVDENLCWPLSCKNNNNSNSSEISHNSDHKKSDKKFVLPLVASMAAVFAIFASLAIFWFYKRRNPVRTVGKVDERSKQKNGPLESRKRQFTYSEILTITRNLERVIGSGGFGTVYLGHLDQDTQVAVKMLSPSSVQGYEQFRNEAKLLMRVHHRNLTSLVGYCNEGSHLGLIYEYMANGNLEELLFDRNTNGFNWEKRLEIAIDSAQGLEYLHHGCKPPIVHRDVKSTNILLNKEFQAKLADFGLSKLFPAELGTHVVTRVVGSPGYLDPESKFVLHSLADIFGN